VVFHGGVFLRGRGKNLRFFGKWNGNGTDLERIWNANGTEMEQQNGIIRQQKEKGNPRIPAAKRRATIMQILK
jgi:hypothetical protein